MQKADAGNGVACSCEAIENGQDAGHSEGVGRASGTGSNRYDLVIAGGGSAAFAAALKTSELGGRAVIINEGLPIGGTCVNVGCVPSKALIRAAEAHYRSGHHGFDGIESSSRISSFDAITSAVSALVGELRQGKYVDVVADDQNIEIVEARARIMDSHTVTAGGRTFKTENILIATGARTFVPEIPGLVDVPYLTNESAYVLKDLPEELIVIGGRYIALENAQMFARLGSRVTILQRSDRILPTEASDLTDELTRMLDDEGIRIVTGVAIESISGTDNRVEVQALIDGQAASFSGTHLFVATGRRGNTENLGLENLRLENQGLEIQDPDNQDPDSQDAESTRRGYVPVDETLRIGLPNVFAAGDVIGEQQFVYTAAYEGSLAAENAMSKMYKERDYSALPWVVFTDPQVAGVGLDEPQAEAAGIEYEVAKLELKHVPRSIAARDTRGFIKLVRETASDRLIGARILAPEGSELLMEVTLAIKYGITVSELTSTFHPYLTLGEGIKLAAITFGKDVGKLSCCAV